MSVVDEMLSLNAPIYTVHDNFITTAQYSDLIPKIYSSVIRNMGPPLSIINEFIYMNVIKPILIGVPDGHTDEAYFTRGFIPKETLYSYLKDNVPKKINKKKMKPWDERISGIMTSYDNYTRIVCGDFKSPNPKDYRDAHEKKWEYFQSKLRGEVGKPYYCVHY
ncbi:unnamed protein product [Coffea canephora]|uniref:DH200=94 genomic scaffold, scaffold_159 n=1 Tax=Coffea canephora TaxID=49390 RepID=A0A068VA42_COFCA|nr:unnamed protein product [Coffea canephora]